MKTLKYYPSGTVVYIIHNLKVVPGIVDSFQFRDQQGWGRQSADAYSSYIFYTLIFDLNNPRKSTTIRVKDYKVYSDFESANKDLQIKLEQKKVNDIISIEKEIDSLQKRLEKLKNSQND